jgi:O-antigen/teichoic acid export membrane protein
MPYEDRVYTIVPRRRLISSGLAVLGVLLLACAAAAYVAEDMPHWLPFVLSLGALVAIAWSLILGAIERVRHMRPTNLSDE